MSNIPDDVGGLVTAGLVGGAAASELAALPPSGPTPERCANCGAALVGPYCHACGQRGHVHRSIVHLVEELLHGVFHFEGRVWHTLPALFFRPGDLTWRYVHGERARFVSPLALFLFSVFLLFLVFGAVGGAHDEKSDPGARPETDRQTEAAKVQVAEQLAAAETRAHDAAREVERARATGRPTADLEAAARGADAAVAALRIAAKSVNALAPDGETVTLSGESAAATLSAQIDTGHPALDRALKQKLRNPELLLYKLRSHAYKLSWVLVLIAMPFMWLLFSVRREVKMYDHAIFLLYSLSFVSIFAVLAVLAGRVPGVSKGVGIAVVLGIPAHVFAQLKGAYRLTVGGALWRTAAMFSFSVIWALAFLAVIVAIDFWG